MVDSVKADVLLVGGGIMSATLGMLLKLLDPQLRIVMIEQLAEVALESSDAMNNAGTGHAGYCELNYTPQDKDGHVDIQRALEINAAFEVSLQFWASLVEQQALPDASQFINQTPHLSFVWGQDHVAFLKQRHALLSAHHLFADMQYSEDFAQLTRWIPLMMAERETDTPMAATYVAYGTDVNFGALTRLLVAHMRQLPRFEVLTTTRLTGLKKHAVANGQGLWHATLKNLTTKTRQKVMAKFVFLGAGGGALPLLQKAKVPESEGYGGFPVSGQWLICHNEAVIAQHQSKVYGKAAMGAPPMSVPHLDTRIINGKRALLFGPFAGFTTRFLKQGSRLDLAKSIKPKNIKSLLGVGRHHADLTRYLIKQTRQTHAQRMAALREFLPNAKPNEWTLANAGQRVQIIKHCEEKWGKLEFGTEIVATNDGSLAALLGASPGASVSVKAMLDVLERCFKDEMQQGDWPSKLRALIPSYGQSLIEDAQLLAAVRNRNLNLLKLTAT